MAEPPPKRAIDQVIHDDLEPGVINEKMIKDTILAEYKGELGRMKTMERIELDKITVLRLEFLKILRIDHLWMLTSLKLLSLAFNRIDKIEKLDELTQLNELNISYNYIEVIENLEKLQNLKSLSLFGNRIKMVENIEELTSLKILSLGNNKIDSLDGVKRLRFLKNLRCLNLEGNPIAKEDEGGRSFRSYISVFVPQLKYYAYVHISEEERETAFKVFRYDLHELEETEAAEVAARAKKENDLADEIQLSDSFVEFLNGHQLFDSFFEGEEDARALMSIGEEAVPMYNTFKEETYILTQKIYKNGLEQYDKRQKEIEMFEECVKLAREKVQEEGKKIITTFLEKYPPIKEEAVRVLQNMETEMFYSPDQLTQEYNKNFQRYEEILNEFDILVDLTWKSLMQKEIQLFEAVEDANANFEHNMQDMINEFIEAAQTQFVLMRDHQTLFTESLTEAAQFFISLRAASGETADVPPELRDSLEDRDIITNLSEGMKTVQMVRIDAREDRLAKRSREWCKNLALKYQEEEIQRNRAKVNEISYFLENYKFEFSNLQENIKGEDITKA